MDGHLKMWTCIHFITSLFQRSIWNTYPNHILWNSRDLLSRYCDCSFPPCSPNAQQRVSCSKPLTFCYLKGIRVKRLDSFPKWQRTMKLSWNIKYKNRSKETSSEAVKGIFLSGTYAEWQVRAKPGILINLPSLKFNCCQLPFPLIHNQVCGETKQPIFISISFIKPL